MKKSWSTQCERTARTNETLQWCRRHLQLLLPRTSRSRSRNCQSWMQPTPRSLNMGVSHQETWHSVPAMEIASRSSGELQRKISRPLTRAKAKISINASFRTLAISADPWQLTPKRTISGRSTNEPRETKASWTLLICRRTPKGKKTSSNHRL